MIKTIDVKKSRFRDASWFDKIDKLETPIIIGGAGGIGSSIQTAPVSSNINSGEDELLES